MGGDEGPAHELGDGEEFEEGGFLGDESVTGFGVDAVEEVVLFVVMGCEDDVVDDSLEDLGNIGLTMVNAAMMLDLTYSV